MALAVERRALPERPRVVRGSVATRILDGYARPEVLGRAFADGRAGVLIGCADEGGYWCALGEAADPGAPRLVCRTTSRGHARGAGRIEVGYAAEGARASVRLGGRSFPMVLPRRPRGGYEGAPLPWPVAASYEAIRHAPQRGSHGAPGSGWQISMR